jgi:uncharacterized membrane protein
VAGELSRHKCESSGNVRHVKKERSDKFEYDVTDTLSIRKRRSWIYIYIFWNVSIRLKVKEKSTHVDGISKFSGIEI